MNVDKLYLSELLHLDTGRIYFQVIENDDWKMPLLAIFRTREQAERYIKNCLLC